MSQTDPTYRPHVAFAGLASAAPEIWRVLLVMVVFEAIFFLSPEVFAAFLPNEAAVRSFYEGTTAFGTLAQFFSFGVSAAGLIFLLRLIHGRGFWSLVGPADVASKDLRRVTLSVCLVLLIMEVAPPWIIPSELQEVRPLANWVLLIPVTVLALLIQVGTEEIYFRGYLQQQFACINSHPLVWMFLPSILFGAMHFWNGHGAADGLLWAIWATFLGLACADLTARTGTIGAAIGLHLANNLFAVMIVGVAEWPGSGLALFVYPYDDPSQYDYDLPTLLAPWAALELILMTTSVLVMWLAARIAIKR